MGDPCVRISVALAAAAVSLFTPRLARAHDPFEITTDAHVSGPRLEVHTTMSLMTAARACLEGDAGKTRLELGDFEPNRSAFEACAEHFYRVDSGRHSLPVKAAAITLTEEGDVDMKVTYPRPSESPLTFDAVHLARLGERAGVVLTVTGARTFLGQRLLRAGDGLFEIPITSEAEAWGTPPMPGFRGYFELGIRHILTGYDHLLFLFGLLAVRRSIRAVAVVITSFTAAHSLTLALAALGRVSLPRGLVEPLIAGTIACVGMENFFRRGEANGHWAVIFAFGLVHGLGFASALRELGLGRYGTSVTAPIVAFNLGVEVGQLAVAAPLFAILWTLRRQPLFARYGARAISFIVAVAGICWLCMRIWPRP